MICEKDVPGLVGEVLPYASNESNETIYNCIHRFAEYTKQLIEDENLEKVGKCFTVAETLLCEGNTAVKVAIQNNFLSSVSHCWEGSAANTGRMMEMLPRVLKTEYVHQIYAKGC